MAKANKFVHYNTRAAFDAHFTERGINPSAAEGNDLYYYTVYIKDTEEIYTHGKFYGDKGVEIDILALQNGDTEVGKALYQKLAERYDTVPGRLIGHYVYKDPSAPNFAIHAPSMLIIFDYIDVMNAFSGHHISVLNNDIKFNFMTLASTGECVFGDRTIVTEDMFHTGNKEGTIGLGTTDIPVKGLKSAAYVDVEDIIYTLDVAETDASVSLSDEEFETIVAHESINVVVNGQTYTSTHKNSFAGGTIIQYECSFAHHDCVTDITITFDRNAKTYYCVKQDNDIYAQRADFATDLSGRLEATPEVFTYRPSAGDKSIKDDNAFIRRVKGNSVVWNQLVNGSAYSNTQTKFGLQCSIALNSREIRVVGTYANNTPTSDRNWYDASALTYYTTGIVGHKYLCQISGNKECSLTVYGWCSNSTDIFDSIIKECTSAQQLTMALKLPLVADGTQIDETIIIDIHDLTAMFGTGNEPTTVEEFRALYPNSYYPYNIGELRNLVCSGIKTVGFNEFNGTYARVLPNESYYLGGSYTSIGFAKELGGATETISIPSNRIYTPTQLGYIYASGTDICINLHHTGYRDGEYEPYKEVTHALPLSQITNGEPLRKAGGEVYDEINETEYIRRVGVRGYATGDKDDATLLTDGTYTNYPLDEPIITPIETPIDFNYYVEDFGTEEAMLAENSAPFSADIVYQFNAVDRIRQNDLNIDRLEGKVLALPSEFKTINGNSIVGSGDLIITAGNVGTEDDDEGLDDVNTQTYLRYVEQSLTDEQKLQARINIGASSNIIIGNATQNTTSLQHNVLLKWTEDGTTESMFLEFPTNDGSTVLNCGFLLYLTPDATSDYSLYLDGIEIY